MMATVLLLGVFALAGSGYVLLCVLWRILHSAVAAASVCRWLLAVQHKHPKTARKPWWQWLVQFFFRQWWGFICSGVGNVTIESSLGTWYGIGRWEVRGP